MRFNSGMTTQQRLVIRDGATWAKVWAQIAAPHQPPPAVPAVDFAKDVVIVAAMGTKDSGGYSITINDVGLVPGGARISVTEESAGANCGVTMALTSPVAVVLVPRFDGGATFQEHTSKRDCK
jgi:hypothetical protein